VGRVRRAFPVPQGAAEPTAAPRTGTVTAGGAISTGTVTAGGAIRTGTVTTGGAVTTGSGALPMPEPDPAGAPLLSCLPPPDRRVTYRESPAT
jgi:hypothetical protein